MKLTSTSDNQKISTATSPSAFPIQHHVCLLAATGIRSSPGAMCLPARNRSPSSAMTRCPEQGDDVNREGRSVPATLPRVDFFHWVLIDLPASVTQIAAGEFSADVTPRRQARPGGGPRRTPGNQRLHTSWFAGDNDMRGDYYGYDGPCPPWNDELRHRYVFTVFALDIERLPLEGKFGGQAAREAMAGTFSDRQT